MRDWMLKVTYTNGTERTSYWRNMFREDMEDVSAELLENSGISAVEFEELSLD